MKVKYKLTVVSETEEQLRRVKHPVTRTREEYTIGTFPDEEHLRRWAEENQGELAKAYPDEVAH